MTTTIDTPRAPRTVRRGGINWEKWGWIYMRASGVVLVVLIFGHLFVNLVADDGISGINFGFVAGKWADLRWQIWDLLMLWLAMIHGANGMRTIINDYAEKDATRLVLKALLLAAFVTTVVLGTLVIFTFDPCPAGSPAELLPSFCTA